MNNSQIADTLEQFADLLEFQGANSFKIRAYRNSARVIRDLTESVKSIIDDPQRNLIDIPGIGKAVAEKSQVLLETGKLPQLEELLQEIPESVLGLLRVPGLGPKKAATLYQQLNIVSLDQLREACETDHISRLKGFGKKTQAAILHGIDIAAAADERILWAEADVIAQSIGAFLHDCPKVQRLEFAGSYRRGKETVGDLDILVDSDDATSVMDFFSDYEGIEEVIARGDTKMSVRLQKSFQVDLRVVPQKSFGAALQYFTGSKDHNVVLRGRAKQQGLKVNEWGVFKTDGDEETYVAGINEREVYQTLDLPLIPPELREARDEFQWAEQGALPTLLEVSDIFADLHTHTTDSDGKSSMEEMAQAAIDRGLKYLAITDHSKRVGVANGLDEQRLLAQWKLVDALNERLDGRLIVLKGVECDILEDGPLDIEDDVLVQADWVMASVHFGQRQSREQITDRILGALAHPSVSAIAHPTGRLLNRREAYQVDIEAVFQAAKDHRKILELNANPKRLDLNDTYCAAAKKQGVPIVISTDAHRLEGFETLRYGVLQARRGGLTKEDVINAGSPQPFLDYLSQR